MSAQRLSALRTLLQKHSLSAYIIPTADAHQSEYVAPCDMRRSWLSGFDGSAGTALVTASEALLWTDGRYFLQGEKQLDKSWSLMKSGTDGCPRLEEWIYKNFKQAEGSTIGFDPFLTPMNDFRSMEASFKGKVGLKSVHTNLVDEIWDKERPRPSQEQVFPQPVAYAGETTESKVKKIRKKMSDKNVGALVISALDEVAWLLNLRGNDIKYNPVFMSYVIITLDRVFFYVDKTKLTPEAAAHLKATGDLEAAYDPTNEPSSDDDDRGADENEAKSNSAEGSANVVSLNIVCRPYEAILTDVKLIAAQLTKNKEVHEASLVKLWLDPQKTSRAIHEAVLSGMADRCVVEAASPIALMKGIKNAVEISGMRNAHIRDGAAVCKFICWLGEALKRQEDGGAASASAAASLTEVTVADRLAEFRSQQKDFMGLSFETISSSGPNGAVIHYAPTDATARKLSVQEVYLVDSGAQYRDGTTDITRTMHFGCPKPFERLAFTRVLQGHIGLASAVFPPGTPGPMLDILARRNLWASGLDYVHGTGHGIGSFLNVHEGPHGISSSARKSGALETPLVPGMMISNEPGYYHDGEFGIRIENIVVVQDAQTDFRWQKRQYLRLDTITMVPMDFNMIDWALMTPADIEWLDRYHEKVWHSVSPLLTDDKKTLEWLYNNTKSCAQWAKENAEATKK